MHDQTHIPALLYHQVLSDGMPVRERKPGGGLVSGVESRLDAHPERTSPPAIMRVTRIRMMSILCNQYAKQARPGFMPTIDQ